MAGGKERIMTARMAQRVCPQHNALLVAATIAAILTLLPVAAHQLGLVDHLPDPPGTFFASDAITESKAAHTLGVPDALIGLGSYGVTLGLVLLVRQNPRWRKWLKRKLVADGSVAFLNAMKQIVSFHRICSWCTGTAVCTAGMVFAARNIWR